MTCSYIQNRKYSTHLFLLVDFFFLPLLVSSSFLEGRGLKTPPQLSQVESMEKKKHRRARIPQKERTNNLLPFLFFFSFKLLLMLRCNKSTL
jgi:hypothetical protein